MYKYANNGFYPYALKDNYIKAGVWPEDGIDVDEAFFEKWTVTPPMGKERITGDDGLPAWGDIPPPPPPTPEELQRQAEYTRMKIIRDIREKIEPLHDAVYLNVATEEEKTLLDEWIHYRLALYQLDVSTAPDIHWPEQPK